MDTYSRTNLSLLGAWWLSLDRWNITAPIALAAVGAVLVEVADFFNKQKFDPDGTGGGLELIFSDFIDSHCAAFENEAPPRTDLPLEACKRGEPLRLQ